MKRKLILIVLALLVIVFVGYNSVHNIAAKQNGNVNQLGYENIFAQEAKERLESETGIILLDVRTQAEYIEKHIPDSLLIPLDTISEEASYLLPDKNKTIFVYCRSGSRSAFASEILVKMGYKNIYNIDGGIINWPYETESGSPDDNKK